MTDPIEPPVEVILARRTDHLPSGDALPGGTVYEPKFDGWRLVVLTAPVRLQTRSGRLITERFPEIAAAAGELPAGTVLDGELVIWQQGRLDFAALQRRTLHTLGRPPANLAVFDLLAVDGRDLRRRPYGERRARLTELLKPYGPPLQPVPVTEDRGQAAVWYEQLVPAGIEGLVAKGRAQPYQPGRRGWLKVRHAYPQDAVALGLTGTPGRPRALVVDLGDGPVLTAPLEPSVRARLRTAWEPGGRSGTDEDSGHGVLPDGTVYRRLPAPLLVEVLQESTRNPRIIVTRVRSEG